MLCSGRESIAWGPPAWSYRPQAARTLQPRDLQPGMVLAFELNWAFGRHIANLGGTVVVGDDAPIELNPLTADVLDATAVPL